jgi:hypothetical protein
LLPPPWEKQDVSAPLYDGPPDPDKSRQNNLWLALGAFALGSFFLYPLLGTDVYGEGDRPLVIALIVLMYFVGVILLLAAVLNDGREVDAAILSLPEDVPRDVYQLGSPKLLFQTGSSYASIVLSSVLVAFLGLIFIGMGAISIRNLLSGNGRKMDLVLAFGGVFGGGSLVYLAIRNAARPLSVLLFSDGFVSIKGKDIKVFPWKEIANVWEKVTDTYQNGVHIGTDYFYKVQRLDGESLSFSNSYVEKCKILGPLIQQEASRSLLARAHDTIAAGGEVEFGAVRAGPNGLSKASAVLPWQEIGDVQMGNGQIFIGERSGNRTWCKLISADTANVPVLLELINQRTGMEQSGNA